MSYSPAGPCNQSDIIENLRNILSQLHCSTSECILCSWVDHEENFTKCHEGSSRDIYKHCKSEALFLKE